MAHMPIDYGPYASYSMENRLDRFLIYPFASVLANYFNCNFSYTGSNCLRSHSCSLHFTSRPILYNLYKVNVICDLANISEMVDMYGIVREFNLEKVAKLARHVTDAYAFWKTWRNVGEKK